MATYQAQSSFSINGLMHRIRFQRGLVFGVIIIGALLAFESFNYSTTEFALSDLLGDLSFADMRWSTILALAFCGIDFAGIARLFTHDHHVSAPAEVWYLFGAWLLAATMNAVLTWWGVSIAILEHQTLGNAVVERATLLNAVPIFVAVMVWLSRVLIIGTFSMAGGRLFSQAERRAAPYQVKMPTAGHATKSQTRKPRQRSAPAPQSTFRPTPKTEPASSSEQSNYALPEPTYHSVGMRSRSNSSTNSGYR